MVRFKPPRRDTVERFGLTLSGGAVGFVDVRGDEPHRRLTIRWTADDPDADARLQLALEVSSSWR